MSFSAYFPTLQGETFSCLTVTYPSQLFKSLFLACLTRFTVNRRISIVGFGLYGSIHGPTDYQVNIQVQYILFK